MPSDDDSRKGLKGIWIGVDLGTTNSTAAFYSPAKSKAKLIRFQPQFAKQQNHNKFGRSVPSAISYDAQGKTDAIGISALKKDDRTMAGRQTHNENGHDRVILSSVKRIWGMDAAQVRSEVEADPTFLEYCPFDTQVIDEDVKIRVGPGKNDFVTPIDVAELLLKTIRDEAEAYFGREKETAVGMPRNCDENDNGAANAKETELKVLNCVITVPAHFSRNRRDQMVRVAKKAGFNGYVGTIVESTAAAMAYGLFTTPMKIGDKHRRIMVLDMGGGTTDVTIAEMVQPGNAKDPSFKVLGTVGEKRLGGDDMDWKLVELVRTKISSKMIFGKEHDYDLRMACRDAKEKLCGDGKDELPASKTRVNICKESVIVSQEEFDRTIQPIVEKAARLVDTALLDCHCSSTSIDEVILVGGATRTPSIRTMLQAKFKNELCYAIDPYAAVAQGAAIQAAIESELVPMHELRNALMLDALPHPIGVLLQCNGEEQYVPILECGMELPAMHYASFRLDNFRQKGVTIVAVEDVDDDLPLERIGEFTFLLHRLSEKQCEGMEAGGRMIDVGMTVERSGKFIVSIFDKNDPDHLLKKQKYQEWKRKQDNQDGKQVYALGEMVDKTGRSYGKEELMLLLSCAALFILYVAVKMTFQDVEEIAKIL